jgi:hypothetical protein
MRIKRCFVVGLTTIGSDVWRSVQTVGFSLQAAMIRP